MKKKQRLTLKPPSLVSIAPPKAVCFIQGSMDLGSVDRICAYAAGAFLQKGYQVDVITHIQHCSDLSKKAEKWFDKRVTIYYYSNLQILQHCFLNRERYGAVLFPEITKYPFFAKLVGMHAKLIVVHHGWKHRKFIHRIRQFVGKYLIDSNNAVSQGTATQVQKALCLRLPIPVLHNPIVEEVDLRSAPNMPHRWFKENIPVVVACGRLIHMKGFDILIEAVGLVNQHQKLRLIILGEGEDRSSLERKIKDMALENEVILPGFVFDRLSWMYHARLFVLSSRWEPFGNVVVEALSMGTPVVSTDCDYGPREILEEGKWGTLVKERTPQALAKGMKEALEAEKPKRSFLRERAKDFLVEPRAQAYVDLVEKLWKKEQKS